MNEEKIRKEFFNAEVSWGSYSSKVCHNIQKIQKDEGLYDNNNFYEFCKGYIFSKIEQQQKIEHLEKQNKILKTETKEIEVEE